jgi:hypothetical protein
MQRSKFQSNSENWLGLYFRMCHTRNSRKHIDVCSSVMLSSNYNRLSFIRGSTLLLSVLWPIHNPELWEGGRAWLRAHCDWAVGYRAHCFTGMITALTSSLWLPSPPLFWAETVSVRKLYITDLFIIHQNFPKSSLESKFYGGKFVEIK